MALKFVSYPGAGNDLTDEPVHTCAVFSRGPKLQIGSAQIQCAAQQSKLLEVPDGGVLRIVLTENCNQREKVKE